MCVVWRNKSSNALKCQLWWNRNWSVKRNKLNIIWKTRTLSTPIYNWSHSSRQKMCASVYVSRRRQRGSLKLQCNQFYSIYVSLVSFVWVIRLRLFDCGCLCRTADRNYWRSEYFQRVVRVCAISNAESSVNIFLQCMCASVSLCVRAWVCLCELTRAERAHL